MSEENVVENEIQDVLEEVTELPAIENTVVPDEGAIEDASTEEQPPKVKKTVEERVAEIRKATWERREAERKSNEAARIANEAADRLEKAKKVTITKPDINDFETDEQYQQANESYLQSEIDSRAAAIAQDTIKAQYQKQKTDKALKDWDYNKMKEMETNPNFQQDENKVANVFRYFNTPYLEEAMLNAKNGIQITKHLSKNVGEAERIAQLSPMQAIMEFGALQGQLSQIPRKRTTNTPAPVRSEQGGGGAPTSLEGKSDEEYERIRNEQVYGKR